MKNYNTAKMVFNFLFVLGWIVVLLGAALFITSLGDDFVTALSFGGSICTVGIINIAIAQIGLAQIDTAENTSEMKQMFKQYLASTTVADFPTNKESLSNPARNFAASANIVKTYRGYHIHRDNSVEGCFVNEVKLSDINEAKIHIDNLLNTTK